MAAARAWDACRDELELDPKLPLAVGIDLALTHDTTAVVAAQRQGERIVLEAHFWANPFPPGHSQHDDWELDVRAVMDYLREIRADFPASATRIDGRTREGPAFCYDAVVDARIAHDGDPTLAAHLRNVMAVPLGDHGWRLRKITRNSGRKIDGAIAAVMAVHQALEAVPPRRGGYAFVA